MQRFKIPAWPKADQPRSGIRAIEEYVGSYRILSWLIHQRLFIGQDFCSRAIVHNAGVPAEDDSMRGVLDLALIQRIEELFDDFRTLSSAIPDDGIEISIEQGYFPSQDLPPCATQRRVKAGVLSGERRQA